MRCDCFLVRSTCKQVFFFGWVSLFLWGSVFAGANGHASEKAPYGSGLNFVTPLVTKPAKLETEIRFNSRARLTHGPRLGAPAPNGFKVWVRANGRARVNLETRKFGSTNWVTRDTQPIDVGKSNTAVLRAKNLKASTKYEYRILLDEVEVASHWTITMPPAAGGRFVMYQISDTHTMANLVSKILPHYNAHYATDGIPAIVISIGDFYARVPPPYNAATRTETSRQLVQKHSWSA
jgi:hypothetical protein